MFPREILTILYGSEYTGGYMALIVLSFGISMNDFAGTSANILVAGGRTKLNLTCEVLAAVTNVILNIILIPRYGIVGAAIGTGVSFMTRNISALLFVNGVYGIHPYKKNYLNFAFSGALASVIVYILKINSPFSWWITMLILGSVFIAIYLLLALVSRGFDANDRVVMEAFERKLGVDLGFMKRFI